MMKLLLSKVVFKCSKEKVGRMSLHTQSVCVCVFQVKINPRRDESRMTYVLRGLSKETTPLEVKLEESK